MASIRQTAGCIGLSGSLSIIKDFFGYIQAPQSLSLLAQVHRLQGPHIHLNLIRVGIENFTLQNEQQIDSAVQLMRDIYANVGVGVGRVARFFITEAQANELGVFFSSLTSDSQAEDLTDAFTVQNDALDVFILRTWDLFKGGMIGFSPEDGPCDKDDSAFEMTGSVVSIEGKPLTSGIILAHEVGHYLGLHHIDFLDADDVNDLSAFPPNVINNLMFPAVTGTQLQLTSSQGTKMKKNCFIRSGC